VSRSHLAPGRRASYHVSVRRQPAFIPRGRLLPAVLAGACLAAGCDALLASGAIPQAGVAPLIQPAVLAGMRGERTFEATLAAAPATLPLGGDKRTDVWAYNGTIPGPTLDVVEGDRVVIQFRNNLPEASNIHWHGLQVPPDQDGMPMDLVPPGGSRVYAFTVPRGTAGTYWYHPHPHGSTTKQVAMGLAGALRVRAAADPMPAAFGDDIVFISDFEPDAPLVNGRALPGVEVRSGEVRRFRLINASTTQAWRIQVPDHAFLLAGTDGGYIGSPVERQDVRLAPGERADVLLRMSAAPGTRTTMVALPFGHSFGPAQPGDIVARHTMSEAAGRPLVEIRYGPGAPVTPPAVPGVLRPVPPLRTEGATARTIALKEFAIDDKVFDPARVDARARLGDTEVWTVRNDGRMDHPFHLHGFQFQILDRNGATEPIRAWKDTVFVPSGQSVRFAVKFEAFAGPRVYHCHVLEHEDKGMMALLQVDR